MKKAFTLLEIVFIIIVIAILARVAVTSFKDDNLALATYQVVNHIRYTQHLAMSQNKFDPKDNYYHSRGLNVDEGKYFRSWWQIRFVNQPSGTPPILGYSVYSDIDREGNIDITTHREAAVDPLSGRRLSAVVNNANSEDVNLLNKYNVINIVFGANCQPTGFTTIKGTQGILAFDEKGRPYYGIAKNSQNIPYEYILKEPCTITLTTSSGSSVVTIQPETGYVSTNL